MKLSTRLTIAMVALVLVTIAVTEALTYGNLLSLAVPRSLERLGGHVQLLATELEAVVRGARADVLAFAVDEMVDGGSGDITDRSSIFAAVERRGKGLTWRAPSAAHAWVAKPGQRRGTQDPFPKGFPGSNPGPRIRIRPPSSGLRTYELIRLMGACEHPCDASVRPTGHMAT